jgi:hypothetical protein
MRDAGTLFQSVGRLKIMAKGKSKLEKLREDKARFMDEQKVAAQKVRETDAAIAQEERSLFMAEVERASDKHGSDGLAKLIAKANELGVEEVLKRLAKPVAGEVAQGDEPR